MCNKGFWCCGKKRRQKKRQRESFGKRGLNDSSMITTGPQARSLRMDLISAEGAKIKTHLVTETYEAPSKEFATVEQVIASQGYELAEELGRGMFGIVYRAKRMRDGAAVACKVVSMTKPHEASNAKNELYVLERISERTLSHPHIIKLHKHFVVKTPSNNERRVYIFMQLAEGGSLSTFLKTQRNGLAEDVAKRIFAQIVSALNYMHGKGFAHLDIKPGNVLLEQKVDTLDNAKCLISDFGLSRLGRNTDGGTIKVSHFGGTKLFMAPEIFMLNEYAGDFDPFKADIW